MDIDSAYLSKVLDGHSTPSPELDNCIRKLASELNFELKRGEKKFDSKQILTSVR